MKLKVLLVQLLLLPIPLLPMLTLPVKFLLIWMLVKDKTPLLLLVVWVDLVVSVVLVDLVVLVVVILIPTILPLLWTNLKFNKWCNRFSLTLLLSNKCSNRTPTPDKWLSKILNFLICSLIPWWCKWSPILNSSNKLCKWCKVVVLVVWEAWVASVLSVDLVDSVVLVPSVD